MSIIRKAFKIFNGSVWDEYHLKTDSKQVIHTKADGTDTTVAEQLLALNSTLNDWKWSDWVNLGSALGILIKYRCNAYEVELLYSGTFEKKKIAGGSAGYTFPALPNGLNPRYNVDHSIYACAGDNAGAITLQCYPTGNPNTFKITSHKTITVEPEYVCGRLRYTRN